MAQEIDLKVEVKTTWVKPVALFICQHLKKKWMLSLLYNLTIARLYIDGKLKAKIRFSDILE